MRDLPFGDQARLRRLCLPRIEERPAALSAASDTHQEATVKAASTAHVYRFPPVDMLHASRYWRAWVDRSIATRLLFTDALLRAQRENLALTRYRVTLRAASLRGADTRALGRVARQVAEFHRAHGRLLKRAKQLRQHVARYTADSIRQTVA